MGVIDDLLSRIKMGNDDDEMYDDEYDDDDEDYEPEPQVKKPVFSRQQRETDEYAVEDRAPKKLPAANKVTSIKPALNRRANIGAGMEVCVIRPNTVEEAREVTETLLAQRTVVLNLEGVDVDIAQRIIDFTSGSCFAIHGNLQKIANFIFIITPESVEISGDIQDIFGGAFGSPLNS